MYDVLPGMLFLQVGSDLMADELQCIRQHQQKHGVLVRVLDAEWLRRCGASRAREDEEALLYKPAPVHAAVPRKSREGTELDNRECSRFAVGPGSSCEGEQLKLCQ